MESLKWPLTPDDLRPSPQRLQDHGSQKGLLHSDGALFANVSILAAYAEFHWVLVSSRTTTGRVIKLTTYVGVDIGSRFHKVAVMGEEVMKRGDSEWKKTPALKVLNRRADFDSLVAHIVAASAPQQGEAVVGLESSGYYYSRPIVELLGKRFTLLFVDGAAVKDARERFFSITHKDDDIDARCIARLLFLRDSLGEPLGVSPVVLDLADRSQTIRVLTRQRRAMRKMITATTNRLHRIYSAIFPEAVEQHWPAILRVADSYPTPSELATAQPEELKGIHSRKRRESLIALAKETIGADATHYRRLVLFLAHQLKLQRELLEEIEEELRGELSTHPQARILLTIPGIGPWTTAEVIGLVGDIRRYPTKKKFRKMLGVYPVCEQSGISHKRSRMGRGGARSARGILYMAVVGLLAPNRRPNFIADYVDRRRSEGMGGKAAVIAAMGKLTETIWSCVYHDQPFDAGRATTLTRRASCGGSGRVVMEKPDGL